MILGPRKETPCYKRCEVSVACVYDPGAGSRPRFTSLIPSFTRGLIALWHNYVEVPEIATNCWDGRLMRPLPTIHHRTTSRLYDFATLTYQNRIHP